MSKREELKNISNNINFVDMEKQIMDFWKEEEIEKKYIEKNRNASKSFSFIDGPMTANNPMGIHHAWGRTYKDVVQRYKNMQGYEQRFQNGFDCQGLWVEVEVEKELGFNSKKDITEYGMDKFTNSCINRVNYFANIQMEQSKRLGMFMDWDNSYYTMSKTNNLYIWYFLKKCHERNLIYKNKSATTWCPRCETGLSQHEQAEGYKMIKDTSVYLLFKLSKKENEYILAWTTTPWTLSANVLLAVNSELDYVKTNIDGKIVYLGALAAKRLGLKDVEKIDISELIGEKYESLYDFEPLKDIEHKIVAWNLVDADSGSGVVHIAPGCGQEDYELGKQLNAPAISPVDSTGKFLSGYGDLTGKYAHDVSDMVIQYLLNKGLLFKTEEYEHSYPHCWRCKTKCLFRLEDNWFINVQKIRKELKEQVDTVKWNPVFVGKRMHSWLDSMGDWMISRKRFYGLALPFYECSKCNTLHVVGSLEELKKLAVEPSLVDSLESIHRPWIDEIKIKCPNCGEIVNRISDVGDCWLDAGVVPFSTLDYLDNKAYWEKWFPADFITEMLEQVRLWFYSMLVFGVILEGKIPYKEVLGYAELRDENNERMSKTNPNNIKFDEAANRVGSDTIRWNYVTASIGGNMKFGWQILEDVKRRFYLPLWNSFFYLQTYSKLHNFDYTKFSISQLSDVMDKWIIARLQKLQKEIVEYMEVYNISSSTREIEEFIKELSQWYIRRNRVRFTQGESDALGALQYVLLELSKLLAPFVPFISELIYLNLGGKMESVHLESAFDLKKESIDEDILKKMNLIREICSNGLKIREEARINLRQPLLQAYVGINDAEIMKIVREELNVKQINYSKEVIKKDGFQSFGEGEKYISLNIILSDDLKKEGMLNDFLRKYRDIRKKQGLKMNDTVSLKLFTENILLKNIVNECDKAVLQVTDIEFVENISDMKNQFKIGDIQVGITINL